MKSKKSEKKPANNAVIITGIFAIITAVISGCFLLANTILGIIAKENTTTPTVLITTPLPATPNMVSIAFRVTELSGASIRHAKIVFIVGTGAFTEYTDSNGMAFFSYEANDSEKRVFVETDEYEIYDQIIFAETKSPQEIRLKQKDVNKRSVIIRVFDNERSIPVDGAEVVLIVNGAIYTQFADSHGITKFTTAFPSDEIDGDISVSFNGYKIENQRVTLQADRIQDIRLDKTAGTITVESDLQNNPVLPTLINTPIEGSTLTPFLPTTTPTFSPLILSTVPTGCNEIAGYGWLGAGQPDRCFVMKQKPECPNIEVVDTFCQCNEAYGLTANVSTERKELFDSYCGKIGFPNPPPPLILIVP